MVLKSCLWPNNGNWPNNGHCPKYGHAKTANLIMEWHPEEVPGVTNKQYLSKELGESFSIVFFSFRTALVIEKIEFEFFSYPYLVLYKAATEHCRTSRRVQILGIPTAKIQFSNGCHTCYRYTLDLKSNAK